MLRSRIAATLLLGLTALGLTATAAQAQDYPGTTAAPVCTGTVSANAPMLANATVTITATCPSFVNGTSADGILNSTPVALPATVISGKAASYTVKLPADWDVNAFHTLTLQNASTDALIMNARFYVDGKGRITAPPKGSGLARTGASNRTDDYVKGGIALVAAGAGIVAFSRKRNRATAAA